MTGTAPISQGHQHLHLIPCHRFPPWLFRYSHFIKRRLKCDDISCGSLGSLGCVCSCAQMCAHICLCPPASPAQGLVVFVCLFPGKSFWCLFRPQNGDKAKCSSWHVAILMILWHREESHPRDICSFVTWRALLLECTICLPQYQTPFMSSKLNDISEGLLVVCFSSLKDVSSLEFGSPYPGPSWLQHLGCWLERELDTLHTSDETLHRALQKKGSKDWHECLCRENSKTHTAHGDYSHIT